MFKQARIENLWLPFFCVTCNLSKSDQAMHKQGLLWKKIRGSTAVPGVYPPLVIHGHLHLDGGIVNNLPTDVMRKLSSSIGTIIAVELIHNVIEEKNYKFPPILTLSTVILSKLHLAYKDYKFPHFVDMFLRSLLVGSTVKQTENARSADVLISPDLSGYNLLNVTNKQADQLIELGYEAAIKAVKRWQHGEAKPRRPKEKSKK
jgi:predicted acylesterase/phospholipase RssA